MECPRCDLPLDERIENAAVVRLCKECRSQWYDASDLKALVAEVEWVLEDSDSEALDRVADELFHQRPDRRGRRECPECEGVLMERIAYGNDDVQIAVDRCPDCHGVWLDGESMDEVPLLVEVWSERVQSDVEEFGAMLDRLGDRLDAEQYRPTLDPPDEIPPEEDMQAPDRDPMDLHRFGTICAVLRPFT